MKLKLTNVFLMDGEGHPALMAEVRGESGEGYWLGTVTEDALTEPEKHLRELAREIAKIRRRKPRPRYLVDSLMPEGTGSKRVH